MHIIETQFKIHLELEPLTPQNQTENYQCGYKTVIFTPNINLMIFFSNPWVIYIFM